jgi:hypothetical protein
MTAFLRNLFLTVVFLNSSAFAGDEIPEKPVCCVCQTGESPKGEVPFFKMGCSLWLAGKKCDYSSNEQIQRNGELALPAACSGGTLKLGYVGHWYHSQELVTFLQSSVVPTMKAKNMSVELDNTACDAMESPETVRSYIAGLALDTTQYLKVKGNQVRSVGMWNFMTFGGANLHASVDSRDLSRVVYPKCKSFHHDSCTSSQANEWGYCENEKTGELQTLTCGKRTKMVMEANNKRMEKRVVWNWYKYGEKYER